MIWDSVAAEAEEEEGEDGEPKEGPDSKNTEKAENSENDILVDALKSGSQKSLIEADEIDTP